MSAETANLAKLLRRIGAAPDPERLTLLGLCPKDACRLVVAWENLIDRGVIARVVERCGVWHYRLTDSGRVAVERGRLAAEVEYATQPAPRLRGNQTRRDAAWRPVRSRQ